MKKKIISIDCICHSITTQVFLFAVIPMLFLSSCADDLMEKIHRTPLMLSAGAVEAVAPSQIQTRAATNIQGSTFDGGETIVAYIVDTDGTHIQDGSGNSHYPASFVTSGPDVATHLNVLTHSPQLYYPLGGKNINIKAYYPSFVTSEDTKFTVKYNQGAERDYKDSDLMYAEKLNQPRSSEIVNLLFTHKMVKFIFNVEGDGANVTIGTPYLTQVNRAIGFNPVTGDVSQLTDGNQDQGDVQLDNGGAIIIPPQTINGNFIGIGMSSVRDGETRTGTATFSLQTPKELESGKVYTVNIVLGHDNLPEEGSSYTYPITKWDDDAGVISIAPAGTTGIGVATPDDEVYTGSEIKPKPEVRFGKNRVLNEGTDYDYQYFNNVHGGKAIVLVVGKGDYTGFSVATSFTITPATSTLTYASDAENWSEGQEQGKVKMKYTYNGKVDNLLTTNTRGEVTIAYNSTDGNVATVNSNGEVTVKGVGTTKITADIAATADWKAAHAEYELTVEERSAVDSSSEISVELDYQGQEYVYDGTTQWKPAVTVSDTYTEDGETKTTVIPDTYYEVSYTDPVNANQNAEVVITFVSGAPYKGTIKKTYAIAKANSNLQVSKTSDMYIALPTNPSVTEANRTRTLSRSFGTVSCSQPTGSEDIATVSVTDNSVTITGKKEGDFVLTLNVAGTDNWTASSQTIHVYVVKSEFLYVYTGYSQRWKCPATGTYLLEVYGGQGGGVSAAMGGYGAKVEGRMALKKDDYLYVNVGQKGLVASTGYCPYNNPSSTNPSPGNSAYVVVPYKAWNGGGALVWGLNHGVAPDITWWVVGDPICGGGGGTDISLGWKNYNANTVDADANKNWYTAEHLLTRIIVAGGGGGALYYTRETGTANGTGGGAWEAETMATTSTMTDPGEGGKINRGGFGGIYQTNRSTYASYTTPYDSRPTGWSGSDGIFGDGGYWYCVEEGGGAGGGGWYGGGSCGQSSANGSGAGGSSYAWTDGVSLNGKALSTYYPKATELANDTYYSIFNNSSVKNPNEDARGFSKLTDCSATANGNGTDDSGESLDGKAKITCVSITD